MKIAEMRHVDRHEVMSELSPGGEMSMQVNAVYEYEH